jgi:glycosyltransferase involved in cell wall biosynthesis
MYPEYRRGMGKIVGPIFALTSHYMRLWDYATAGRVDYFVANSNFVASRIRKYYGRESQVIYPPVDTTKGHISSTAGDYYVAIGRLVDYKRVDLAVRACTELDRRLKVIGDGPEYKKLRRMAGSTIEFLGHVNDEELRANLAGARALLFPGEEDFGIVPVEAQSFGKPVIAYASGGVLETVRGALPGGSAVESPTGVFFAEQSPSSLAQAMLQFEAQQGLFSPEVIRQHSHQFDVAVFKSRAEEFFRFTVNNFQHRNGIA